MAELSSRILCPVCKSYLDFFPDIIDRCDGLPTRIGFRLRCPNPQPIVTDTTGWYTQPFAIKST